MEEKDTKTPGKSEKSGLVRFIILAVLAVLIVAALYLRLTNRTPNSSQKADEQMNEVQTTGTQAVFCGSVGRESGGNADGSSDNRY